MKRLSMIMMCLLAMMVASTSVMAQEVAITISPGWNWISCPMMDTLDFATAMGTFTPMTGDRITSQWGFASYSGGQWHGNISQFYPGYGYHYKSNRTVPVTVTFAAQQSAPQVIVTTAEPTDITANSAICGGNVASSSGDYVSLLVRGVCWSTHQDPTLNDSFMEVGNSMGNFTSSMTGLNVSTTYYVRAYAVTSSGTVYGEQQSFTTQDGIPILTTADITNITGANATSGGSITDDGGLSITARGVCWGTSPNPTIEDSHTIDGNGMGNFSSSIIGLNLNTTYYVRAYATNNHTTSYGNEVSFITMNIPGAIDGLFSVSNNQQVYFSQGNLQYTISIQTWSFMEHQYDVVETNGQDVGNNYSNQDVISLFGWGTSGYDHGAIAYQPFCTSKTSSDYYAYGSYSYNLYDQTRKADWGYNPIINGGNQENLWRTLTQLEWEYVFNTRTTASGIRYAKAIVNNVNGVILLPDDWNVNYYNLNNTNNSSVNFSSNTITDSQWTILEQAGAVFLPVAGFRYNSVNLSWGQYWSATHYNRNLAYYLIFDDGDINISHNERCCGRSVRLVQNFQP